MKSKIKRICIIILTLLIISSTITLSFVMNDWTLRFHSELDRFFGEENWICVDSETKDSLIYEKTYNSRNTVASESISGKFKDWYIEYTDKDGAEILYRITDHAMRINYDEHIFFQSEHLSAKQAFVS